MLRYEDDLIRDSATKSLGKIGAGAKEAVPVLIEILEEDPGFHEALSALGYIGTSAEETLPTLLKYLTDDDYFHRMVAAEALGEIGPEEGVVEALIKALNNDDDDRVREDIVTALGRMGPEPGVVNALIDALDDHNGRVIWNAVEALGSLGPYAKDALPILRRISKTSRYGIYQDAIKKIEGSLIDNVEPNNPTKGG
jgi:HEAT repeat protein